MSVVIVTGYIPLPEHPRSKEEYRRLAGLLVGLPAPVLFFEADDITHCWLHEFLCGYTNEVTWPVADNPRKNTKNYMIVQAQKSAWIAAAADQCIADVFVWIDYGIAHLPDVTRELIESFIKRVDGEQVIAIPGCWPPGEYDEAQPNWRFCGGVMVVPSRWAKLFFRAMQVEYVDWLRETGSLSWDVNTLARVEARTHLPIWHYRADHDRSLFENYRSVGSARAN